MLPASPSSTRTGPRSRRAPGLRRGLAGLACGVGAMAAHLSAGGEVLAVAALVSVALSVALAPLLLGRRVAPVRTLALALVAQLVWHVTYVATAGRDAMPHTTHHAGDHTTHLLDPTTMALHHLLAAAVATAVAVGCERVLVDALDWLLGVVVRRPACAAVLPVRPRPLPAYAALLRVPDSSPHDPAHPLRAPPGALALG